MKRILALALSIFALLCMIPMAAFAADDGLVAYYTFDDASNLGKATVGTDATAVGSPKAATGKVNGALSLDGSSALHVADSGLADLPDVTISAWVKLDTTGDGSTQLGFVTTDGWSNAGELHNYIRSNGKVETDIGDLWGKWANQQQSGTAISSDTWTLLTNVYDRDGDKVTVYSYLNGELVNTNITSDTALAEAAGGKLNLNNFTIGAFTNGEAARFYTGLMDELRIYNKALSATEVAALANDNAEEGGSPNTFDPMTAMIAVSALAPAAIAVVTKKKKTY